MGSKDCPFAVNEYSTLGGISAYIFLITSSSCPNSFNCWLSIDGDHGIPMVATKDISFVAARHLTKLAFKDKTVQPILGDKNYSFRELTGLIGNAIGKPDLQYVPLYNS